MPSKAKQPSQPPNYLLKLTLCKTTNPTVTRLLSAPAHFNFSELHLAIAAAFGWTDACTTWTFRLWSDDPVKYCDQLKYKQPLAIYWTAPSSNFSLHPHSLHARSKISDRLQLTGPGKYWTYDYDISRFHHALEIVDLIDDDQKGRLGCFGGQGNVDRRAWQFADLAGLEGVVVAGKSTWDLDMGVLNGRLAGVQVVVERRVEEEKGKRDERATKAAARKEVGKGTVPAAKKPTLTAKTPKTVTPKTTPTKPTPRKSTPGRVAKPPVPTPTNPQSQLPPTPAPTPKRRTPAQYTTPNLATPASTPSNKRVRASANGDENPRKRPRARLSNANVFEDDSEDEDFKPPVGGW